MPEMSVKSRLSRKLVILFFTASLIPLMTISLVVYQYTSDYVQQEAKKRLNKEASILNSLLYERLTFVRQLIESEMLPNLLHEAKSVYITSVQDNYRLPKNIDWLTELKDSEKLALITNAQGNVYFISHHKKQARYLAFELNKDYLFNGFSILSNEFDYCLHTHLKVLWCSHDQALKQNVLFNQINHLKHSKGEITLNSNASTSDLQFVSRPLFFGDDILMKNWVAFASVPLEDVLEPVKLFKSLFIFVFIMTLVTIGLVSFRQIKRLLFPLKLLMLGAENIARQNFSEPVAIHSGDEFEELGTAFNNMGEKIEGSFDILYGLAEIDRMILQTHDLDSIANMAWLRTQRIVKSHLLFIACSHQNDFSEISLYSGGANQSQPTLTRLKSASKNLDFIDQPIILAHEEIKQMNSSLSTALVQFEFNFLRIIPIFLDKRCRGFVAQGKNTPFSSTHSDLLDGLTDRLAVAMSNISKQNTLFEMAHFDFLTQLPNRKLLRDRMKVCIANATEDHQHMAVIFADLDNFKQINDSLGHTFGDQLLIKVSQKLSAFLGDEITVAREGGDEFIILLPNTLDKESVKTTLKGILSIFDTPIQLNGHSVNVSISLGVSIYPEHGTQIDKLLMNADTALYRSKAVLKSSFLFYDEQMNLESLKQLELETALFSSIKNSQLSFSYQPLINTENNTVGFEALMRWNHPTLGTISPFVFINMAEDTGYILEIHQWMFDEIFHQIQTWQHQALKFDKIAINISPMQIMLPDFTQTVAQKLKQYSIPAHMIELEVTESLFLDNFKEAENCLHRLKKLGISISLDDFGTGYSSLSYLQKLPFDRLKIDQSFVKGIKADEDVPSLVTAIIDMAKNLKVSITAEGVEEHFQYSILQALGCQVLQGYYISRPIQAADCPAFIENFNHNP